MILNYQDLSVLHTLKGHNSRVLSLTFDNVYRKLISLGKDKIVKVWDFAKVMNI